MARMPQIPQTEIGTRPEGSVGLLKQPDVTEAGKASAIMAQGAAHVGDALEILQGALDKKQEILDSINAVKADGEHQGKLQALAAQIQTQNWETPGKAADAFRQKAREITDADVSAAPTAGEALKRQLHFAHTDNSENARMFDWGQRRATQQAKSALGEAEDAAARGLAGINNSAQFERQFKRVDAKLDPVRQHVSEDPAKDKRLFLEKYARAWVDQRVGEADGLGAQLVQRELSDQSGFISRALKEGERETGLRKAEMALEGVPKTVGIREFTASHEDLGHIRDLINTQDSGAMSAIAALRSKTQQRIDTLNANPVLKKDPVKLAEVRSAGERMLRGINYAEGIALKQMGLDNKKVDDEVTKRLTRRNEAILSNKKWDLMGHYDQSMDLRVDALEALNKGKIAASTYNMIEDSTGAAIKAGNDALAKAGGVPLSHMRELFHMGPAQIESRMAGTQRLNDLISLGLRGKALPTDAENLARETYAVKMIKAARARPDNPVTNDEAREMAAAAYAYAISGKP